MNNQVSLISPFLFVSRKKNGTPIFCIERRNELLISIRLNQYRKLQNSSCFILDSKGQCFQITGFILDGIDFYTYRILGGGSLLSPINIIMIPLQLLSLSILVKVKLSVSGENNILNLSETKNLLINEVQSSSGFFTNAPEIDIIKRIHKSKNIKNAIECIFKD